MAFEHRTNIAITFGDCDPAGIVFYPNFFAWFDRTFHNWLRPFGGHGAICNDLSSIGIGLMEANARFHAPLRDGDDLELKLTVDAWERKTIRLNYEGLVRNHLAVTGYEVRGLFMPAGGVIVAGDMQLLRNHLEHHAKSGQ